MAQNLFEQLQEEKARIVSLANLAFDNEWIDAEHKNQIIEKVNSDVLTLGVIGQMKCGKSTFLNAFVFEEPVLPSATTPMTAALSVITYGPEKKIVAEFYTPDEWEEQKMQASRSLDDVRGNSLEESKVKAAKELVEKSVKLGGSISSYLGKTQEDTFDNLIEYVGADGKYIAITKSVTIYYPKEYLKGVEIVDTPGFNDPIVSREERTKDFLKRADVVLLMLYAARAFDTTDRDILFKNVRQCGIGRILIGVNKYDIPYGNGEFEERIIQNVCDQIEKACKDVGDDTINTLIKEAAPIPLSAEMALLSHLPMSAISSNDAYKSAWERACDNFEISSQPQMYERSHIAELISAIKKVIERDKVQILITKPLNAIKAAALKKKSDAEDKIKQLKDLISDLQKPDDELEEKLEKAQKAERRVTRKLDGLESDIEDDLNAIIRKGKNDLEGMVEATCRKMDSIIDSIGRFDNASKVLPSLERETNDLIQRKLKRQVEELLQDAQRKAKARVSEFTDELGEILQRNLEDFDADDFVKKIQREINIDIEDDSVFMIEAENIEEDYGVMDFLGDFINGASFGVLGVIGNFLSNNDTKTELHSRVNAIRRDFDAKPFLESAFGNSHKIIEIIKSKVIERLVTPLQQNLETILADKQGRESLLRRSQEDLIAAESTLKKITQQIEESKI